MIVCADLVNVTDISWEVEAHNNMTTTMTKTTTMTTHCALIHLLSHVMI